MSRFPALSALALAAACALPVLAPSAHAQTPAPAAAASPAKKALVAKVLALQQPGIEVLARQLAEQPAMLMLQQSALALQRLPADKRESIARELQADARKYAEEVTPLVRTQAVKLAPTTIGAMLEERFTEDELKQLVAQLESPVSKKYMAMSNDLTRSLAERLIAETRGSIEPKVKALEQQFISRLQGPLQAANPAPAAPAPQQPR